MDFVDIAPLLLTLVAALLAVNSTLIESRRLTKAGWIALVAVLSFGFGVWNLVSRTTANAELQQFACEQIRHPIRLIADSEEVTRLFAQRGASLDQEMLASLRGKLAVSLQQLETADLYVADLSAADRKRLIQSIRWLTTAQSVLEQGDSDFNGSAARVALYKARTAGAFDVCGVVRPATD